MLEMQVLEEEERRCKQRRSEESYTGSWTISFGCRGGP
jgi:hypothetical protein